MKIMSKTVVIKCQTFSVLQKRIEYDHIIEIKFKISRKRARERNKKGDRLILRTETLFYGLLIISSDPRKFNFVSD